MKRNLIKLMRHIKLIGDRLKFQTHDKHFLFYLVIFGQQQQEMYGKNIQTEYFILKLNAVNLFFFSSLFRVDAIWLIYTKVFTL